MSFSNFKDTQAWENLVTEQAPQTNCYGSAIIRQGAIIRENTIHGTNIPVLLSIRRKKDFLPARKKKYFLNLSYVEPL